jgi:hypothetical protein
MATQLERRVHSTILPIFSGSAWGFAGAQTWAKAGNFFITNLVSGIRMGGLRRKIAPPGSTPANRFHRAARPGFYKKVTGVRHCLNNSLAGTCNTSTAL